MTSNSDVQQALTKALIRVQTKTGIQTIASFSSQGIRAVSSVLAGAEDATDAFIADVTPVDDGSRYE